MSAPNENRGPVILFVILVALFVNSPMFEAYPFATALLLMGIGWVAIKLAGRAVFRLGWRAWFLMLQLAVPFALFLWFLPVGPLLKIVLVWGVGLPLVFVGAGWRWLSERFPRFSNAFDHAPPIVLSAVLVIVPPVSWASGMGFWDGIGGALALCLLASVPVIYGWALAESPASGDRDARFGTDESFRKEGMSDER